MIVLLPRSEGRPSRRGIPHSSIHGSQKTTDHTLEGHTFHRHLTRHRGHCPSAGTASPQTPVVARRQLHGLQGLALPPAGPVREASGYHAAASPPACSLPSRALLHPRPTHPCPPLAESVPASVRRSATGGPSCGLQQLARARPGGPEGHRASCPVLVHVRCLCRCWLYQMQNWRSWSGHRLEK